MSNKQSVPNRPRIGASEKVTNVIAKGIGVYFLGKTAAALAREVRKGSPEQRTAVTITTDKPPMPHDINNGRGEKAGPAIDRFRSTVDYFQNYIHTPASLFKMISRADMYHEPWAYHRPPTWAALHFDQTKAIHSIRGEDPANYKYMRGIDALTDYGRRVINNGVLRRMEEGGRGTILYDKHTEQRAWDQMKAASSDSKRAAVADRKAAEVSNVVAAIVGMGFYTDIEVAKWQDRDTTYQLVPFVPDSELHRRVAYDLEVPKSPGLLLKTCAGSVGHPEDTRVEIDLVNIDRLRTQAPEGVEIPQQLPDTTALAALGYIAPGVLPSTQGHWFAVSQAF